VRQHLRAGSCVVGLGFVALYAAGGPDKGTIRSNTPVAASRPAATSPATQPSAGQALQFALDLIADHDKTSIQTARNAEPGVHEISMKAQQLSAILRRDSKGIKLTIVGVLHGQTVTDTYAADDEKAMEKERPAAYRFYDTIIKDMGGPSRDLRDWFEHPDEH